MWNLIIWRVHKWRTQCVQQRSSESKQYTNATTAEAHKLCQFASLFSLASTHMYELRRPCDQIPKWDNLFGDLEGIGESCQEVWAYRPTAFLWALKYCVPINPTQTSTCKQQVTIKLQMIIPSGSKKPEHIPHTPFTCVCTHTYTHTCVQLSWEARASKVRTCTYY